jgi:enamine deaminase RidA (YjgF/YER057c/UK114 family)
MSNYEKKLNEMGIALPTPSAPVANYVGFVKTGNLVFISGQLPMENGKLQAIGKVDIEVSVEDSIELQSNSMAF